jgi:hypothetical protein
MVLPENFFSLCDFIVDVFAFFLDLCEFLLEVLDLLLVLLLAGEIFEVFGLFLFDFEETVLLVVELLELLLESPQLLLLGDETAVVVDFLELPLDGVDLILHLCNFELLPAKFALLLPEGVIVVIGVDGAVLLLASLVLLEDFLELLREFEDLLLELYVLLDDFLLFSLLVIEEGVLVVRLCGLGVVGGVVGPRVFEFAVGGSVVVIALVSLLPLLNVPHYYNLRRIAADDARTSLDRILEDEIC